MQKKERRKERKEIKKKKKERKKKKGKKEKDSERLIDLKKRWMAWINLKETKKRKR